MTSMLSILHRMTGVALAVGTLMVIWWLLAAATTTDNYDAAMRFAASPLGTFFLFGWSFSLYYHLLNGIRHLIWDTGLLFEMQNATRAGYAVFYGSLAVTLITWGFVFLS